MNNINNTHSNNNTYLSVISSTASSSAMQVEGVASVTYDAGMGSKSFSIAKEKKNNAVLVNISNNLVTIDIYINVYYGFKIPEVVCKVQEKIKSDVESATTYVVKYINVTVVGVLSGTN